MNLPGVCNHNPETVVWAHSNDKKHGKCAGKKSEDQYGAYACYQCHMTYDGQINRPTGMSKEFVDGLFESAMCISRNILIEKGLL